MHALKTLIGMEKDIAGVPRSSKYASSSSLYISCFSCDLSSHVVASILMSREGGDYCFGEHNILAVEELAVAGLYEERAVVSNATGFQDISHASF